MFSVASRPVLASPASRASASAVASRRHSSRPGSFAAVDAARRVVSSAATASSSAPSAPRPDGFGFSAAGMIFPYHVGAWEVLIETGLLTSDTPVAGASAGALVAAMHACGVSPDDGKRILMSVLADCRENGVVGRVGSVLEAALRRELLPTRTSDALAASFTSPSPRPSSSPAIASGSTAARWASTASSSPPSNRSTISSARCYLRVTSRCTADGPRGGIEADGASTGLDEARADAPGMRVARPRRVVPAARDVERRPSRGRHRHRELLRAEREFLGGLGLFGDARVAHRAGRRGRRAERRLRRVGAMGAPAAGG